MKRLFNTIVILLTLPICALAQFDGAVGTEGCKAIAYNDPRIVGWATGCIVERGYQNIADKGIGVAGFGEEREAIGPILADEATNTMNCISLGDSGVAILTFQHPIRDGEGYDFAVYENSFSDGFLELALAYVSSDSVHWFGFPTTSNTQTATQVDGFGTVDPTMINNIAGKYRISWGTPFDLSEIADNEFLDKNNVKYVKLVDCVGTIDPRYATRDSQGNIINDPYPTPFASSGFDLSGVAVLNWNTGDVTPYEEFDGAVGTEGCQAIEYNDPRIVGWATECSVRRGWLEITNKSRGVASFGEEREAIGPIFEEELAGRQNCISLGDSGVAVVRFQYPIKDGEGYDFAIYENSYDDYYLELGLVYVSSDSIHWVGFPAVSNTQTTSQQSGYATHIEPKDLKNLAGKYRIGWGTPFDISELEDSEFLNKDSIVFVKIVDVIGTIDPQYATRDSRGQIINDPYPMPYNTNGFDLYGVAALNWNAPTTKLGETLLPINIYPNPCTDNLYINIENAGITLYNIFGQKIKEIHTQSSTNRIDMSQLPKGIYFIEISKDGIEQQTIKIIKQ